jgi:hypothetical protein
MYKLKSEYKTFAVANKAAIEECDAIFYIDDNKYLHTHKLPDSWKRKIDHLWSVSPLSKIQDGFHNNGMMDAELDDLSHDNICKRNLHKEYWLKCYMLGWLDNLPEVLTDEYLFDHLSSRKAFTLMLKDAYVVIDNGNV